ncbi:MAG: serine/threonine-protein kinase [Gemmataceae bacterium]
MPDFSELGAILTGTRAVGKEQWDAALEIGEAAGSEVDGLLAIINTLAAQPPHWWDGKQPQPPGLTDYQKTVIRSRFVDDELHLLRRDLALNQFLLLTKLGQGGQGEVYRARQLNPPRFAAIKTLVRDTELRRRRFEQEARAMMKIQHPAVARFYLYERVRDSHGEPTDEYVIAMEFVHGMPLHRHVQRSGLVPWRFAIHWTIQLLGGLAAIHKAGLVHGDVKPENVMVIGPRGPDVRVESTGAKLLDFGAARGHGDDSDEPRRTFVGTPEYAPPEQWTGGEVPASDLYSLGGTLYYMLTARFPYQKERREPFAYRESHTNDPLLEVRDHNTAVPEELSAIVKRMMAKRPDDRGTAEELIAKLKALQPRESTPPPADRPRTKPKPAAPTAPVPPPRPTVKKPVVNDDVPNPIYQITDGTLAVMERMFIPGFHRPQPGHEAAIPERILALLRRPLVLVLSIVFAALVLYGLYSLR